MKIPLPLFVQLCTYSEENQELALCLPNFKLVIIDTFNYKIK